MITTHSFTGHGNRCIHCGASATPTGKTEERSCVPHTSTGIKLMPEPARRIFAVDDFSIIRSRIEELRKPVSDNPSIAIESELDYMYC